MIAALFVETNGVYYGLPNVDPYDSVRDAKTYGGPYRVIAHPPCERWGRFWSANGHELGDDNGYFEFAVNAVRTWGGILEHPAGTHAFRFFGINNPNPGRPGWHGANDRYSGLVCEVEQGHYGHRARKKTWLYSCKVKPVDFIYGPSEYTPTRKMLEAVTEEEKRRAIKTGVVQNLSRKERMATPVRFRDELIKRVDVSI